MLGGGGSSGVVGLASVVVGSVSEASSVSIRLGCGGKLLVLSLAVGLGLITVMALVMWVVGLGVRLGVGLVGAVAVRG